jgi:ferric-dicitrate binding protein FerR (iron transport regulator)
VEKYYKVQFLIKDTALSTRKMTSSFQGDSIEEVISILELVLDVQIIKRTTSSYTIQAIN